MKIQTIIAIVLSLLLIDVNLIAQSKKRIKCKYVKNSVDDFTKKRTTLTEDKIIYTKLTITSASAVSVLSGSGSYRITLSVAGYNENGINALLFNHTGLNVPDNLVDMYYQIDLLLENDTVIILNDGESSNLKYVDDWQNNLKFYKIDDTTWEQLNSIPLKKVRIHQRNFQITLDINKKYKNGIIEAISCINILDIPKVGKKGFIKDTLLDKN